MTAAFIILLIILLTASIVVNVMLVRAGLGLLGQLDAERDYIGAFDEFIDTTDREVDESYKRAMILAKTHVASDDPVVKGFVGEVANVRDKLRSAVERLRSQRNRDGRS